MPGSTKPKVPGKWQVFSGTPTLGNRPTFNRIAFLAWVASYVVFRATELASTAGLTAYYVDFTNGNDSNDGLTTGTPIKTLDKAQVLAIDGGSGNVAIYLKRGETWRKPTKSYVVFGTQTSNSVTLNGTINFIPRVGMYVQLQNSGGTRQYCTVAGYNTGTKVLTTVETITVTSVNNCKLSHVLYADKNNVKVLAYGTGEMPKITNFEVAYSNQDGTWTADAGGFNVYKRTEAGTVGWLRVMNDWGPMQLRKMTSLAEVQANEGSWWQNGTTLYVHMWNNADITNGTRQLEAALTSMYEGVGIDVNADGFYMEGIEIAGFGINGKNSWQTDGHTGYCVHSWNGGSTRSAVVGCRLGFCGRHVLGHTSGSAGLFTAYRNEIGFTVDDGIQLVSYSTAGSHNFIFAENTFVGGWLCTDQYAYNGDANYYCHSNATCAFALAYKNVNIPGPFMATWGTFGNIPTWSDAKDCKAYIVDEHYDGRDRFPTDTTTKAIATNNNAINDAYPNADAIVINSSCRTVTFGADTSDSSPIRGAKSPTMVNVDLLWDWQTTGSAQWTHSSSYTDGGTAGSAVVWRLFHYRLRWRRRDGNSWFIIIGKLGNHNDPNRDSDANACHANARMVAGIMGAENLSGAEGFFMPAFRNNVTNQFANAYVRGAVSEKATTYGGWSSDTQGIDLPIMPAFSPLVGDGLDLPSNTTALVLGYVLEYDYYGNPRGARPTRGPVQSR